MGDSSLSTDLEETQETISSISAGQLVLFSLVLIGFSLTYLVFLSFIKSAFNDIIDHEYELDDLILKYINQGTWAMGLSAGAATLSIIFIILTFFMRGKLGKILWMFIPVCLIASAGFFTWAAIVMYKPLDEISDAIDLLDQGNNPTISELDISQLSSLRASLKLIGMTSILLLVLSVFGAAMALLVKKSK